MSKTTFFLSALLSLGAVYAVMHAVQEDGERFPKSALNGRENGESADSARAASVLPSVRGKKSIQDFQSRLTGDIQKDWRYFLEEGRGDNKFLTPMMEVWGRRCPRQGWAFLGSPDFPGTGDTWYKKSLLESWEKNRPEEVREFLESILADTSSNFRIDRNLAIGHLMIQRLKEDAGETFRWALSLKSQRDGWGGDQKVAVDHLLALVEADKKRMAENAELIRQWYPQIEQGGGIWRTELFAMAFCRADEDGAKRWMESLPWEGSTRERVLKAMSESQSGEVNVEDFEENGADFSRKLSQLQSAGSEDDVRRHLSQWCYRNEAEFRQYASSLPEGKERNRALSTLCSESSHMEYEDRLALVKDMPDEVRQTALNDLFYSWNKNDPQTMQVAIDKFFSSEEEKKRRKNPGNYGKSYEQSFGGDQGGFFYEHFYMRKEPFMGSSSYFLDAAANTREIEN